MTRSLRMFLTSLVLLLVLVDGNHYESLGVSRYASQNEIFSAFRHKALELHPDKFHGSENEYDRSKYDAIVTAKEVLTDPQARRDYDKATFQDNNSASNSYVQFTSSTGNENTVYSRINLREMHQQAKKMQIKYLKNLFEKYPTIEKNYATDIKYDSNLLAKKEYYRETVNPERICPYGTLQSGEYYYIITKTHNRITKNHNRYLKPKNNRKVYFTSDKVLWKVHVSTNNRNPRVILQNQDAFLGFVAIGAYNELYPGIVPYPLKALEFEIFCSKGYVYFKALGGTRNTWLKSYSGLFSASHSLHFDSTGSAFNLVLAA